MSYPIPNLYVSIRHSSIEVCLLGALQYFDSHRHWYSIGIISRLGVLNKNI